MVTRLDPDVRKAMLRFAAEEAGRRGDRRIGTDHLLLGLLRDRGSLAAEVLGVDLDAAREASAALDRAALAAVGIDVGDPSRSTPVPARRHAPLTSGARAVFIASVTKARAAKARRIEARFVLLALLERERPDPAAELLDALDVDVDAVRARLSAV